MKKKLTVLGALLMAVVVTGYSVSGTYAKYVSKVDLTDEARIAKFELKATDKNGNELKGEHAFNLFADSYSYNGYKYVKSMGNDDVIAPGTTGTFALQLTGDMETAYYLNFKLDDEIEEPIVYYTVEEGKVKEMSATKFDGALEYHPIRYTIKYTRGGNEVITDPAKKIIDKNAAEVKSMLNDYNTYAKEHPFGAGKLANIEYEITWKWATVTSTSVNGLSEDEVNRLDTFAGQNVKDMKKAKFNVSITATQATADDKLAGELSK